MKKRKKKTKVEFSKRWVAVILTVSLIFVAVLIALDRMETLAVTIMSGVVLEFGLYMCKAYFGKKNEEINRLIEEGFIEEERDLK